MHKINCAPDFTFKNNHFGARLLAVQDVLTDYFKTTIQYIEKTHYKRLLASFVLFFSRRNSCIHIFERNEYKKSRLTLNTNVQFKYNLKNMSLLEFIFR